MCTWRDVFDVFVFAFVAIYDVCSGCLKRICLRVFRVRYGTEYFEENSTPMLSHSQSAGFRNVDDIHDDEEQDSLVRSSSKTSQRRIDSIRRPNPIIYSPLYYSDPADYEDTPGGDDRIVTPPKVTHLASFAPRPRVQQIENPSTLVTPLIFVMFDDACGGWEVDYHSPGVFRVHPNRLSLHRLYFGYLYSLADSPVSGAC